MSKKSEKEKAKPCPHGAHNYQVSLDTRFKKCLYCPSLIPNSQLIEKDVK